MELIFYAILLFMLGTACWWAELFVPAHGALAIFSTFLQVMAVALCFMVSIPAGITALAILVVGMPFAAYFGAKFYPRSPVGKRVIAQRPPPADVNAFAAQAHELAALKGRHGVAVTLMRPAGACEIDGRRLQCVSESDLIVPGTPVEVAQIIGLQILVRPVHNVPVGSGN